MKQILLVTDGCSNSGLDPVAAAASAKAEGIIVNVAGVVARDEIGGSGAREIEEIARAGGGMSRIVPAEQLSQTVQMMTRQTMTHTIHHIVNRELTHIMGSRSDSRDESYRGTSEAREHEPSVTLESLHPDKRAKIVQVIDDLSEKSPLRVALLVDTSASMRPKLEAVRETVRDLMLSLQARKGRSELAVFRFPGKRSAVSLESGWTDDLSRSDRLFQRLNMRGTTPTGPAINSVVDYYLHDRLDEEEEYVTG